MNFDTKTAEAVGRLFNNPDFQRLLEQINAEKADLVERLMREMTNPIFVHQLQGSSRALSDLVDAVMRTQIKAPREGA